MLPNETLQPTATVVFARLRGRLSLNIITHEAQTLPSNRYRTLLLLRWDSWHSSASFRHSKPLAEWRNRWENILKNHAVMVAESTGTLVGFSALDIERAVLSKIFVAPNAKRVRTECLAEWRNAFGEIGPRSTFRRAELIAGQIYDHAAPIPDVTPSPDRNAFLQEVAEATREAAESMGATIL